MAIEDLIKECKIQGMDIRQLNQIQQGADFGLSESEIRLYAKTCFDELQMNSIRLAIKHRLSDEEIAFIADTKYNGHQMEQLVTGLKDGLTLEKVKTYADSKMTAHEMCQQRIRLLKESVVDTPSIFSKEYFDNMVRISEKQSQQLERMNTNFSWMQEFLEKQKHPMKTVKDYGNEQGELERLIRREKELTLDNQRLQKLLFDMERLVNDTVKNRRKAGSFFVSLKERQKPVTVMQLMGNQKFNGEQLEQIRLGYEHGLELEEILNYALPGYDSSRMECIRSVLENNRKRKV